jgi:hypothetical protein
MSLEQLLKDTRETPAWTAQRRKLIRFLSGIAVVVGGLVAMAALIFSTARQTHAVPTPREPAQQAPSPAQTEALAELMRLQQKAGDIKDQIESIKKGDKEKKEGGSVAAAPVHAMSYDPGTGFVDLKKDENEIYVPTGAVFQAQLLTPIKTSVDRTFVMAEVTEEYRMDMKRKIPKGSRLIGRARLNSVLKGVVVEFETLVLPNGIETLITGLALSRNALPEIDGLYFSNRNITYGTALAFGFLSGYADAAKARQVTVFGSVPDVSVENQVLGGLSTASFQVANEILQDIRTHAVEYVVVPAGERIFVALTRRYDVNQKGTK